MKNNFLHINKIGYENGCWTFENLEIPQKLKAGIVYSVRNSFCLEGDSKLFGCVVPAGFYNVGDLLVYTGGGRYEVVLRKTR